MGGREYRVGRFTLQPFRQLLEGESPVSIGRKALEILSVLAKAEGALVTKDELMTAVWPNLVVEDNALQVQNAALRKLLGADAELLSTVHGFGYRLAAMPVTPGARPAEPPEAASIQAPSHHHLVPIALTALCAACLVAAGLWLFRDHLPWPAGPREARVAVLPFDTQGQAGAARGFADGLLDEILGELSDNQIQAVSRTESRALRGAAAGAAIDRLGVDLLLDGTVRTDGKTIDVHLFLDDARERVSIWSDEFHGPADMAQALQAQVATQAANVVHWGKTGRSGKVRLDAATLAAFIAGRESTTGIRNSSDGSALAYYRKVVAAAPDFSWGHSGVAVSDAFALMGMPESPLKQQRRAETRTEATRALELEPYNGEAYLALELAWPPLDWKGRETLLIKGITADPAFEPAAMMEGRLLWVVGRGRDALPWFRRAHDIDPLHNGETWSLALSLAAQGRVPESQATVAQMQAHWPNHVSTRDARFWTSIVTGAAGNALALLADPSIRPRAMDQKSVEAWSSTLKAISSDDAAAKAVAMVQVEEAATAGSINRGEALTLLAMLGDLDDAFAQAQLYRPANPYSPPYLFLAPTTAMRADPRFMPLARKLGFVSYWQATGNWPDFCSEPGLPYDCQVEASKAAKYVRN